jgi:hypothetical protein
VGSNPINRPEPEHIALVRRILPDLEALFRAGDDVLALLSHPGWDHLTRLIDAAVHDIDARLDGHLLDSRAEYAMAHGRRSGLSAITGLARAIVAESERKRREQSRKYEAAAEPAALGA